MVKVRIPKHIVGIYKGILKSYSCSLKVMSLCSEIIVIIFMLVIINVFRTSR